MDGDTDFRFLAENSADMICRFGMDRRLHYISPSRVAILRRTPEEVMAMPPFGLVVPEDVPQLMAAIERDMMPGAVTAPLTLRNRRKDGSFIWVEVAPRITRDAVTNEITGSVIVMRDVTVRRLLEERLAALAFTDGLTGLANRRAFDEARKREWNRSLQTASPLSLILLDVDHFKRTSDHYGHQVGDDCPRSVANAVKHAVRPELDIAARYGGGARRRPAGNGQCERGEGYRTLQLAMLALAIAHPATMAAAVWSPRALAFPR